MWCGECKLRKRKGNYHVECENILHTSFIRLPGHAASACKCKFLFCRMWWTRKTGKPITPGLWKRGDEIDSTSKIGPWSGTNRMLSSTRRLVSDFFKWSQDISPYLHFWSFTHIRTFVAPLLLFHCEETVHLYSRWNPKAHQIEIYDYDWVWKNCTFFHPYKLKGRVSIVNKLQCRGLVYKSERCNNLRVWAITKCLPFRKISLMVLCFI